jgi:hypothetical protein
VSVTSANNILGGTSAAARNVISGNTGDGIQISGANASGNVVAGNYIGTDVSGLTALANAIGIEVDSAPDTTIGGLTVTPGAGAGNVISGNAPQGVVISGAGAAGTVIEGNIIGLGADGSTVMGGQSAFPGPPGESLLNFPTGLVLNGTTNVTIGGTASGARNVISGNYYGVLLYADFSDVVAGNYLGTDITGLLSRGNEYASVSLDNNATDDTIGGATPAARNVISGSIGFNGGGGNGIDEEDAPADNLIGGNYIGLDATGTAPSPNRIGIYDQGTGDTIGGTTLGARNVISGNTTAGIFVVVGGDTVEGNYIGTNAAGTAALGNSTGIELDDATNVTIGGTAAGAGNLISGNTYGVSAGNYSEANVIAGNYIGTDATGNAAVGNFTGILDDQGGDDTIGGTAAGAGNVISGNVVGISVDYLGALPEYIQGNLIGLGEDGSTVVANTQYGIFVGAQLAPYQATGVLVGGTAPGARNVISGNAIAGILLGGNGPSATIQGNYIGTDPTGTLARGNGTGIISTSLDVTIGGTTAAARNVISGNLGDGVNVTAIIEASNRAGIAAGDLVDGNYIGTDFMGTIAMGNGGYGVEMTSDGVNTLGGTAAGAANVISGNGLGGVNITGGGLSFYAQGGTTEEIYGADGTLYETKAADTHVYQSNIANQVLASLDLGTQPNAMVFGPNGNLYVDTQAGSIVEISPTLTVLGTFVPAATSGLINPTGLTFGPDGNLYVADFSQNSVFEFNGSTGAPMGPFVSAGSGGLNGPEDLTFGPDGNLYVSSYSTFQIDRYSGANGTFLGSFTAGGPVQYPSGPVLHPWGLAFDQTGVLNVVLTEAGTGNSDGTGVIERYNPQTGTDLGPNVTGLTNPTSLSFSPGGVVVQGNFIGTTPSGTVALPNTGDGIDVTDSPANSIGGTTAGAGNVISGNAGSGVAINGNLAAANVVVGNFIGTDLTGTSPLGNMEGVSINGGAYANMIGGTTAPARNIISGNNGPGVVITSSVATSGNLILGNYIGTDITGTTGLPNISGGVEVLASNNTIGGTQAGAGNIIAFNGGDGAFVGDGATGVSILGNSSFANAGLGIHLDRATDANDNQAAPVLTGAAAAAGSTTISGMLASVAGTTFRLEFFTNQSPNPSGYGEGQTFLGSATVTTGASGYLVSSPNGSAVITNPGTANASFTASGIAPVPAGQGYFSATATNLSTGDTSQFSQDLLVAPTVTTASSSANPSFFGQTVTFTVKVTAASSGAGIPTGSVDFVDTTTDMDLGTVLLSGGSATLSTSSLAAAANTITAQYSGGTDFGGSYRVLFLPSSSSLTQTVIPAVLVLDPTAGGALSLSGNADINLTTGNIVVDSNSKTALTESGNASIKAASIQVVGGVSKSGNASLSPAATTA